MRSSPGAPAMRWHANWRGPTRPSRQPTSPAWCSADCSAATADAPGSSSSVVERERFLWGVTRNRLHVWQIKRGGESLIQLERFAVFAVARQVDNTAEQELLPVHCSAPGKILEQAQADLLVVRIVAELSCRRRQQLHERRLFKARGHVSVHKSETLVRVA